MLLNECVTKDASYEQNRNNKIQNWMVLWHKLCAA
jgi:hypothetical protein